MTAWLFLMIMLNHPGCELVSGEQIFSADLARALPIFAAMPRDVVIGYSPAPGARRILQLPELKRIGAQYGIPVPMESHACFEWKVQPITEDAVRAAIRESLQAPAAQVEILAMSKAPAPEGQLVFPQSGLSAAANIDPSTPVTWRGYLQYSSPRRFAVWARVRVSAAMPRVIATAPLPAGKPVAKDQVRLETSDDFPLRNDTARSLEEVIGRIPRRAVRAGLPVLRSDLAEAFQVERGDTVEVMVVAGAAQLELDAQAEASGRQGDVIPLRNPRSGKLFRARIDGKGRAVVMVGATGLLARAQ
jgi:flagellar basal body P-ring formation protein FlgA